MYISAISDVHVGKTNHSHYETLLSFLDHPETKSSSIVALLGDVFDHLTGEHEEYGEKFSAFFDKIASHLEAGRTVLFVEGNHDFHFEKTFRKILADKVGEKAMELFIYHKGLFTVRIGAQKVALCHGDQMDESNPAYKRWKTIYTSKAFGFFISKVLNYSMVEAIGSKAANNSRQRGSQSFDPTKQKAKYRALATELLKNGQWDVLVAGHTHILDDYKTDGKQYLNIGFPPRDKNFLKIGPEGPRRISLV